MTLSCVDFCCECQNEYILQAVNFIAEEKDFIVIVGSSNSGKTTLVECLSGRPKNFCSTSGRILIDGLTATPAKLKKYCRFVHSKQVLLPHVTVLETLRVFAKLTLSHLSISQQNVRIQTVLKQLGLNHRQDTLIGGVWHKGLSTGEQRRVQIAISLLSNPKVLILDDCITGLDTYTALELIISLRNLALSGCTVICTLSQITSPILSLIDKVIVLAYGRIIYNGKILELPQHLRTLKIFCHENINCLNFLFDIVTYENSTSFESYMSLHSTPYVPTFSSIPVNFLFEGFRKSELSRVINEAIRLNQFVDPRYVDHIVPLNASNTAVTLSKKCWSSLKKSYAETCILSSRFFKNNFRSPSVYFSIFFMNILQSLFLGIIFWQLLSGIPKTKPFSVDFSQIRKNSISKMLVDGIHGDQPFLDSLTIGVDGRSSQPLLSFLNSTDTINYIHALISCASLQSDFLKKYPSFGIGRQEDWTSDLRLQRLTKPREVLYNFITLFQSVIELRNDMTKDWDPNKDNIEFWTTFYLKTNENFIAPYRFCVNILKKETGTRHEKKKNRNLFSFEEVSFYEMINSVIGWWSSPLLYSLRHYMLHMADCHQPQCQSMFTFLTFLKQSWKDLNVTVRSLLSVCGCLFFVVATLGFSTFDVLLTFPREKDLFSTEIENGFYMSISYFLARNFADLPFQILPSFVSLTIFYFMAGLGTTIAHYFFFILICIGIIFAAYGLGYFMSFSCPSIEISMLVTPFILIIFLTLAGFVLRDENIPSWLRFLDLFNFYKWGFFSLIINQFPLIKGGHFGVLPNTLPRLVSGVFTENLFNTILIVYSIGFLYRFLGYIVLLIRMQPDWLGTFP
ncbi:uncharacterized protein LOC128884194 [Hylaeus volcanicus]|uniref:uncharacterized protein LOC128884194 n=1 Tax=Hylaeus volcanicus TaxID=313075 RepID=UPI0023B7BA3F|nr:uncharacterized protein LOC128884194 [Hylaeus volcanicus]